MTLHTSSNYLAFTMLLGKLYNRTIIFINSQDVNQKKQERVRIAEGRGVDRDGRLE